MGAIGGILCFITLQAKESCFTLRHCLVPLFTVCNGSILAQECIDCFHELDYSLESHWCSQWCWKLTEHCAAVTNAISSQGTFDVFDYFHAVCLTCKHQASHVHAANQSLVCSMIQNTAFSMTRFAIVHAFAMASTRQAVLSWCLIDLLMWSCMLSLHVLLAHSYKQAQDMACMCRCVVTKSSYTEDEDFSKADAVFDCIGDKGDERFTFADMIGDKFVH